LGVYGGLKEAKKPEVGIGIFFKSPLQTFLRNKQLKFLRPFFKKPILIRVKGDFYSVLSPAAVYSYKGVLITNSTGRVQVGLNNFYIQLRKLSYEQDFFISHLLF
jgi:hypothetical protein